MDYETLGEKINAVEFDHPFMITTDGRVVDAPQRLYAPAVYHDESNDVEIDNAWWRPVSHGWTHQHGYRGPVLHPSEFIGRGIAEELAEYHDRGTPFVVTVVDVLSDDPAADTDPEPAGWIVLAYHGPPVTPDGWAEFPLCSDCAIVIANDDWSGIDDPDAHRAAMDRALARVSEVVIVCTGESHDELCGGFRHQDCGGCGADLATDQWHAAIGKLAAS